MKKYIALMLAALMLAMASCSSGEAEDASAETTAPEETVGEVVPEETEAEETEAEVKVERPEDEEVITYITLELEKDPVYDRTAGLLVMYFTDHEMLYSADAKCYIGLISDEEAISITGTPDMAAYPDMMIDEDDFCGIAIKVDEEIPAGEYLASVTFDSYIVSFDFNVQ